MVEHECDCDKPEIRDKSPEGCTLNQIIKCHGDQPLKNIIKWIEEEQEK
ncbi:MAG: hypothetical protein ACFFAO_05380 [Candidatus Hermodarchaeota archaeon]